LYKLYNEPDAVGAIKAGRVRWLGHLFRMDDSSPCKKATFNYPYGNRRIERPPTRWLGYVERDLKTSKCNQLENESTRYSCMEKHRGDLGLIRL
jgi:hypothetical protein